MSRRKWSDTPEGRLTRAVRNLLDAIGLFHWKHWQGPMSGLKGISDIIGVSADGRFVAIELKAPGNKPTADQETFLENVRRNGGVAFWADSVEDVVKGLREHEVPGADRARLWA